LSSRDEVVLIMSVQASDRSDDGSNEDREQVDYEDDDEQVVDEQVDDEQVVDEQVDDEQVVDEQVDDEQVVDEQVADKQVAEEQVADQQVAEKQAVKQASKGPKSSPKHIRFAKDMSDCEGFEDGTTSSEEEKPSSPLKLQRRKKGSVAEQRADEAARKARIDGNSASSSLEFLTSTLPHPFTGRAASLPTGTHAQEQALPIAGQGHTVEHVPLTGPFVTEEEAANLAAAREAQRVENAASKEERMVLRNTRSSSASAVSSLEKSKVSTRPSKGSSVKKFAPSKKKKSQSHALDNRTKSLLPEGVQDKVAEQDTTAIAEQAPVSQTSALANSPLLLSKKIASNGRLRPDATLRSGLKPESSSSEQLGHSTANAVVPTPLAQAVPSSGSASGSAVSMIPYTGIGGKPPTAELHPPMTKGDYLLQGYEAQLSKLRLAKQMLREELKEEVAEHAKTKQVKDELTQVQGIREARSLSENSSLLSDKIRLTQDNTRLMEQASSIEDELKSKSFALQTLDAKRKRQLLTAQRLSESLRKERDAF
jgi:hypothetical protein